MNTWNTLTIASLGKVVTGKTPPSAKPEQFGDDFPFVTPSDIKYGNKRTATERFLSERGFEAHKRIQLPKKTVCVVCIGATIGKVCFTDQPSISNQQINSIIVDLKKHDPDFVFYIASLLRGTLEAYAGGAATPIVNKTAFSKIKLRVPSLDAQRKIAAILTAYDDLIEVNKRRIALLEKMAEELYREWFVRLRFPGYQNTRFVKGVPEGWELTRIDQLADFENGDRGRNYPQSTDFVDTGIPFINAGHLVNGSVDLKQVNRITEVAFNRISSGKIRPGDILFCVRGSLGRLARVETLSQGAIASSLVIIRASDRCDASYLYYLLSGERGKNLADELNNGVAQPNISVQSLKRSLVLLPPAELTKQFGTLMQPVWHMMSFLRDQSENLHITRDLLLPRLISGKLSVEDLDIQFPPSMQETPEAAPTEQEVLA